METNYKLEDSLDVLVTLNDSSEDMWFRSRCALIEDLDNRKQSRLLICHGTVLDLDDAVVVESNNVLDCEIFALPQESNKFTIHLQDGRQVHMKALDTKTCVHWFYHLIDNHFYPVPFESLPDVHRETLPDEEYTVTIVPNDLSESLNISGKFILVITHDSIQLKSFVHHSVIYKWNFTKIRKYFMKGPTIFGIESGSRCGQWCGSFSFKCKSSQLVATSFKLRMKDFILAQRKHKDSHHRTTAESAPDDETVEYANADF